MVAPPRLDLANEDLIRSHVHAIWLAENGAGLGSRLPDVVDIAREDLSMPLYEKLDDLLADQEALRRAGERARVIMNGLENDGVLRASPWWTGDTWIEDTLRRARGPVRRRL